MLTGIAVSNSILIVEFTRHLRSEGMEVRQAVAMACRVRLRPVLMTSLATIIGLLPMAMKLGAGSEAYAPLARAILGGLAVSVALTVFLVPAAYVLVYGKKERTEYYATRLDRRFSPRFFFSAAQNHPQRSNLRN
jgi:HAE1 family hydrophobic/amphiphilic exporter-1